jgi:hypothetical protein
MTSMKVPQVTLIGSKTKSLLAEGADIKGNLLLQDDTVEGEVRLLAAQIGSTVNCRGTTIRNPGGKALRADRIKVEGGFFLRDGFSALGEVTLSGARVSILSCAGGTFRNPAGFALLAENARVEGNVFLGLTADGMVDLFGIQVGGTLNCVGGTFGKIALKTAVVKGVFVWQGVHCARLNLSLANVGAITDEREAWPEQGQLVLDGLVYERFTDCPADAGSRLEWIDRQGEFKPQPYRQLAKVLREMGDDGGAKQVQFELESRSRAEDRRRIVHAPLRWLQSAEDAGSDVIVGYGVYPGRAALYACVLTALGWVVHRRAQRVGAMAPTDKDAYEDFRKGQTPVHYQPFSPLIYSVENCVPLVKLGQDEHWQPDSNPQRSEPPVNGEKFRRLKDRVLDFLVPDWVVTPAALRWVRWIMIGVGWVLATFFVAALTGVIKAN